MTATAAELIACDLLVGLPARRKHTVAVGRRVSEACAALRPALADALIPAGYLHDIGYAPAASKTGLHQLDGARWIAAHHPDLTVEARLVAHHSFAVHEAQERDLSTALLVEFPALSGEDEIEALGILTYADMTTSAHGTPISVDERFRDIYRRYNTGGVVPRAMQRAEPAVRHIVQMVQERLATRASA